MTKNRIGIFWGQFELGVVESHIKYLLCGWKNKDNKFKK